ncbi:NUDIX domain-containing protein [bacterium]|nr:NUDIX domain-containing protein [bacterium]
MLYFNYYMAKAGQTLSFVDHTCSGGVVTDSLSENCRIVLIEVDKGRYARWLLPKGHVNAGEPYEEAARREVSEETGIPLDKLDVLAYLGKIDYSFPAVPRDELHRKKVHFFLMHSRTTKLSITPVTREEGIARAHWFPLQAAKEIVRYDGNREVIERAEIILEQLVSRRASLDKPA